MLLKYRSQSHRAGIRRPGFRCPDILVTIALRHLSPGGLTALALVCLTANVAGALRSPGGDDGGPAAAPAGVSQGTEPKPAQAGKEKRRKAGKPDPDAPGPDAQVLGSSFCSTPACHGSLADASAQVRHTHWTSDPKYKDAAGCEVCHGPGSDHVGDEAKRKIFRFTVQSKENAARVNAACLQCHERTLQQPHYTSSAHGRAGLSCASCHEVHYNLGTPYMLRFPGARGPAGGPTRAPAVPPAPPAVPEKPADPNAPPPPPHQPRLAAEARTRVPMPELRTSFRRQGDFSTEEQAVDELCASCHRRQLAEARQFSHHPILEGRVKCTSCHDPHRGDRERSLARGDVAETCLQCHEQIRGPFRYEHDPTRAGGLGLSCLECHRPHGSPNRALTTLYSRGLCVQCHTDIQRDPPHRGRTGDCWRSGCHVAVHGSNHSRFLFRE